MPQIISKDSPVPTELPKQSCCSHKKCILISIFLLVAGMVAGFFLVGILSPSVGLLTGDGIKNGAVQKGSYEDGYQSALDFARKKVQEKGMFFPGGQMTGMPNGTVKSVSGNSIVVEFDASVLDFFAEGKLTKTVTIPDSVSIQQFVPRPMEEYQKEERLFRAKMDDYNTKREAGETVDYGNIQPPMPYNIKRLEVKDLKAGDIVSVTSAVDVSKLDTFEATSVNLAYIPEEIKNMNDSAGNMAPIAEPPAPSPAPSVENTPPVEDIQPAPETPNADAPAGTTDSPAGSEPAEAPVAPDTGETVPAETQPPASDDGVKTPAEAQPEPDTTGDGAANGSEVAPQ